MTDKTKSVTYDENDQNQIRTVKQAVIDTSALLAPFLDKVEWAKGKLLYPLVGVAKKDDVSYVIDGLTLTKAFDTVTKKIAKETLEDANPTIGMESTLNTLMAQQVVRTIEALFVTTLLEDTTMPEVPGASADWTGIQSCINNMGVDVYTTEGRFIVALPLAGYLSIIGEEDFKRSMNTLGDKIHLVVCAELTAGQMIIYHEHGVVGSIDVDTVEQDSSPMSDLVELIAPYKTALAYDTDYIRVVK